MIRKSFFFFLVTLIVWALFPNKFVHASCDQNGFYNACNNTSDAWAAECESPYWDGFGYYNSGCPAIAPGSCGTCQYKHCTAFSEAQLSVCGGGNGGNTVPTCSITTNKSSYDAGDYINFQVNTGGNGEVFGGNMGTPQLYFPVISGSGCTSLSGFCPSTNLCSNSLSQGQCQNVCTSTHVSAVNPDRSSRSCVISVTVSNRGLSGNLQTGNCSITVPVNPSNLGPNLMITNFVFTPNNTGLQNSVLNAKVTVKNTGTVASGAFKVSIDKKNTVGSTSCNGTYSVQSGNVSSLSPGSSINVNLSMPTPAGSGNFKAAAIVDLGCKISETNENDNRKTAPYSIN